MGVPYTKPHLPVPDQLALLKQRGLIITDDAKATDALKRIGYYRLSGWCRVIPSSEGPPLRERLQLVAQERKATEARRG